MQDCFFHVAGGQNRVPHKTIAKAFLVRFAFGKGGKGQVAFRKRHAVPNALAKATAEQLAADKAAV